MNSHSSSVEVTGPDGLVGTIDTAACPLDGSRREVEIVLADGRRLTVPVELLRKEPDGRYHLPLRTEQLTRHEAGGGQAAASQGIAEATVAIPVVHEEARVEKRVEETGRVRIRKVVREEEQTIDEPLTREEVTVERRPVRRPVEGPQQSRTEGDALIIPVVSEVLVVEKRLMVTEELVVRKRRVEEHHPQTVTVRREEAVVERLGPQGAPVAGSGGGASPGTTMPPGASAGETGEMGKGGTPVAPSRPVTR
jgi:uncharacterized protein (TIGR02271 family)